MTKTTESDVQERFAKLDEHQQHLVGAFLTGTMMIREPALVDQAIARALEVTLKET